MSCELCSGVVNPCPHETTMVLDLDDFCEENHSLDILDALRAAIPEFKVTCFTIPGRCSSTWLRMIVRTRPWISMVPHGFSHTTSRECQHWDKKTTSDYLRWMNRDAASPLLRAIDGHFGLMDRGFKAPGWQISDDTLAVLKREGIWLADQPYNRHRRPPMIQYYEVYKDDLSIELPGKMHGHIGHLGGHNPNELSIIFDEVLAHRDKEFQWVKHNLRIWRPTD